MKRLLLLLAAALFINLTFADKLVLIEYQGMKELKSLHANQSITIHYSSDDLIIASVENDYQGDFLILDENCWKENQQYYISWFHKGIKGEYKSQVSEIANILAETNEYIFLSTQQIQKFTPRLMEGL